MKVTGTCLDIGCGDERSIGNDLFLSRYFSQLICADVNGNGLKELRRTLDGFGLDADYMVADAGSLPIADEILDGVSAFSVIEHMPRQFEFVKEVRRVLRKGSLFILQFPNKRFPVEVHTGIPIPSIVPTRTQKWWARVSYGWNEFELRSLTKQEAVAYLEPFARTYVQNVHFSKDMLPRWMRPFQTVLEETKLLQYIPMAYFIVCVK
jgi:ubiquinone/menaquinone biosynthesis C-methylase UbiE